MRIDREISRKMEIEVEDHDPSVCGRNCVHLMGTLAVLRCRLYGIKLDYRDKKRCSECLRDFGKGDK